MERYHWFCLIAVAAVTRDESHLVLLRSVLRHCIKRKMYIHEGFGDVFLYGPVLGHLGPDLREESGRNR